MTDEQLAAWLWSVFTDIERSQQDRLAAGKLLLDRGWGPCGDEEM